MALTMEIGSCHFGLDMISEKESEEEQEKNIRTLLVGGIDNGYWL